MTIPTLTFRAPDQGTNDTPVVKTLKADFGDGYTQESPDGINNVRRVMKLTWSSLIPSEANALLDFFRSLMGTGMFWWTPSDEATRVRWTCPDWSDDREQGGLRKVSATFKQSFNLDF